MYVQSKNNSEKMHSFKLFSEFSFGITLLSLSFIQIQYVEIPETWKGVPSPEIFNIVAIYLKFLCQAAGLSPATLHKILSM